MEDNLINNIHLRTIANLPTYLDNVGNIYPILIKEICDIGETEFYQTLYLLTGNENDLTDEQIEQEITYFQYIIGICYNNEEIKNNILKLLEYLLKDKISFYPELFCFVIGETNKQANEVKTLDKDNFLLFQEIVRNQNRINKKPYTKKPKQKYTKKQLEILAKRKRGREMMTRIHNKGQSFFLVNIINSIGILYNDINKILNLNFYQLNMQYDKYFQKERYDKDYQAYLVGADIKDLSIKNDWRTPIIEKEEE